MGGSITVQVVSSFAKLDSTASPHTNNHIFSNLVEANLVQLDRDISNNGECSLTGGIRQDRHGIKDGALKWEMIQS